MESEKKGFAAWVRKHRKQLIKAGLSVAAVAALIAVAYIKRDSIAELWQNLKALLEKSNSSKLITSDEVIRQETTILTEINENVCSVTEQTISYFLRFIVICHIHVVVVVGGVSLIADILSVGNRELSC